MDDWQRQQCRVVSKIVFLGLRGWEDCAVLLNIGKNDLEEARRILLRLEETRTSSATIGGKASPADALSHAAGLDTRQVIR